MKSPSIIDTTSTDNKHFLTGVQLATTHSMLMFLLALFYDLQGPTDDGSCEFLLSQSTCLARKSFLDSSQTYCLWIVAPNSYNGTCIYQDPTFTMLIMLYVAVIVSIITSLFLRPVDAIYEILSAPSADEEKVKKVWNDIKDRGKVTGRSPLNSKTALNSENDGVVSLANENKNERNYSDCVTQPTYSFSELWNDICCQRRQLKPLDLDEFDRQWGIDPSGEFARYDSGMWCKRSSSSTESVMRNELQWVSSEAQLKIDKLRIATDEHLGLELLHLFILDLLGRHTPAAHIFTNKSEEDFRHSQVVTQRTKRLCSLLVLVLNLFFAYYWIVHGYQKGLNWQMSYLIGCVSQLAVEVLLFETMECIWMQFLIPSLVSSEMERVSRVLSDVLLQICTQSVASPTSTILNAADYLFVSTKVAKADPHRMESFIVLSYQSHLPGELSHIWTHRSAAHGSIHRRGSTFRFSTVLGVTLNLLQTLATAPAVLHRMFIRFIQPFFLAVLLYAGSYVIESPVYTAVTAVGVALLMAAMVYKFIRDRAPKFSMPSIHPAACNQSELEPITLLTLDFAQSLESSESGSISGSASSIQSPSSMSSSTLSEGDCALGFSEDESESDDVNSSEMGSYSVGSDGISLN